MTCLPVNNNNNNNDNMYVYAFQTHKILSCGVYRFYVAIFPVKYFLAHEMKTEEKWEHSAPPSCCFTIVAVRPQCSVWRAPRNRNTNADRTTPSILARENVTWANRQKRASTVSKWNGTTQWARRATTVRTTLPIVTDQTVCRPTAWRSPLLSSIEVCRDLPYK